MVALPPGPDHASPPTRSQTWQQRLRGDVEYPNYIAAAHHHANIFTPAHVHSLDRERSEGGLLLNRTTNFFQASRPGPSTAPWIYSSNPQIDPQPHTGINPIEPWVRLRVGVAEGLISRAKALFNLISEVDVTKTPAIDTTRAGGFVATIAASWKSIPEQPSSTSSAAPLPTVSGPLTAASLKSGQSPAHLHASNPPPLTLQWVLEMGSWALDSTLCKPQFLRAISQAALRMWQRKGNVGLPESFNLYSPFARPYHKRGSLGEDNTEAGLQKYLYSTWMRVLNALLAVAVTERFGDDIAAQVFRENDLPSRLKTLYTTNKRDFAALVNRLYRSQAELGENMSNEHAYASNTSGHASSSLKRKRTATSDSDPVATSSVLQTTPSASDNVAAGITSVPSEPHTGRSPDFYFVVEKQGHEPRIMAVLELKPWVTLQFLAYVFFDLACSLLRGKNATDDGKAAKVPAPSPDTSEQQDEHSRMHKSYETRGKHLLDQLTTHVWLSRAPLCVLLTTFQIITLQSRCDKAKHQVDFHLQRAVFSMDMHERFNTDEAIKAQISGCSGACGRRFAVERRVNLICALFSILMSGVLLYCEEMTTYKDDRVADTAKARMLLGYREGDGAGNTSWDQGRSGSGQGSSSSSARRGPLSGGPPPSSTAPSDLGNTASSSCDNQHKDEAAAAAADAILIYRRYPQSEGGSAAVHVGCIVDAETLNKKSHFPFCCSKVSRFNQVPMSEGITAKGECAVDGHTSCIVKRPRLHFGKDSANNAESARRAVRRDAAILEVLRKTSSELAAVLPQPLGIFLTEDGDEVVYALTDAGWALTERDLARVLDLDKDGHKQLLAAVRYLFGCLHRAGWIHRDVALRNICVRICYDAIMADPNAQSGMSDEEMKGCADITVTTATDSVGQFPRQACVFQQGRVLQLRLIDFSDAEQPSHDDLRAASRDEMDKVDMILADFEKVLERVHEKRQRKRAQVQRSAMTAPD